MSLRIRRNQRGKWTADIHYRLPGQSQRSIRKQIVSPVQTKLGAELYGRQVLASMLDGSFFNPQPARVPTLSEYAPIFLSNYAHLRNKPSEVERKGYCLRLYLRDLATIPLDAIAESHIEALKVSLLACGLSRGTVNGALATLSKLLQYAKRCKVITCDLPIIERFPQVAREVKWLTRNQCTALLTALAPPWRAIAATAIYAGLRIGELLELRWSDIDFEQRLIRISRSCYRGRVGTPKSGKSRTIPMCDPLAAQLRAIYPRAIAKSANRLVFCHDDGSRLGRTASDRALKRAFRTAGLLGIGWHTLRHSFGGQLASAGISLLQIANLMGHADVKTTLIYAHLSPQSLSTAVSIFNVVPLPTPTLK